MRHEVLKIVSLQQSGYRPARRPALLLAPGQPELMNTMDFLTSKRFITTAFVLLVVLNITLLALLWRQNAGRQQLFMHGEHQFNRELSFTGPLGLSEAQTITFRKLRQEHFISVRPEMESIALLKKQLVEESLNEKPDNKKIEALAEKIGAHQASLERSLALHFHELAKVCSPAQKDSLKIMLGKLATRRLHGGNGGWSAPRSSGGEELNPMQSRGRGDR